MHPLVKRILWRGLPAAIFLGLIGYLLARTAEVAAPFFNAVVVNNDASVVRGPLIFAGMGFAVMALLEYQAWRRERAAAKKAAGPPPAKPG